MRLHWKILIPIALAPLLLGAGILVWSTQNPFSDDGPPLLGGGADAEEGRVEGTVTDENGNPVADIGVEPSPVNGNDAALPEVGTRTDEDGTYGWSLPPGDYEMTAYVGGEAVDPVTVTVETGETATADFTVPAGE